MRIFFDIARFRLIQIIVFGSLFVGVFYFTLYDDGSALRKEIEGIRTNTNQVVAEVEKKKQELEDVKVFEQETINEEEVVKSFLNFIPSSLTYTEVSTLLIEEAKSAGVNIGVKQDRQLHKSGDTEYKTLNVQLEISGSFSQILLFMSKLTAQRRILVVQDINMGINRENQLIEARLSIAAYRYEKKEGEGEPGQGS